MEVSRSRDKSFDFLKGLTIFLVIYGHSISHIDIGQIVFWENFQYKIIYIFHMPLFMFVSGYFFNIKKDNFIDFIIKKAKQLIIPAIVMTPFLWLAQIAFHETANGMMKELFSLFKSSFWFLKSLFISSVLTFCIVKYLKKDIYLFLPLPFLILNIVSIPYLVNYMYPFFIFGYLFKKYELVNLILKYKVSLLLLFVLLFGIVFYYWDINTYIYNDKFTLQNNMSLLLLNTVKRYIGGITGILILIIFIKNIPSQYYIFDKIGQNTLGIYLIQTIIFQIYGRKEFFIDSMIYNIIIVPLSSILILVVSNIVVERLKKNRVTKMLFLGIWK